MFCDTVCNVILPQLRLSPLPPKEVIGALLPITFREQRNETAPDHRGTSLCQAVRPTPHIPSYSNQPSTRC